MDELLQGLAEINLQLGGGQVTRRGAVRVLEEAWPDELFELCEHLELLKLLVWVCEGSCSPTTRRDEL